MLITKTCEQQIPLQKPSSFFFPPHFSGIKICMLFATYITALFRSLCLNLHTLHDYAAYGWIKRAPKSFHSKQCKKTRAPGYIQGLVTQTWLQLDHRAMSPITCSPDGSSADGQGFARARLPSAWLCPEGAQGSWQVSTPPPQMKYGDNWTELSAL